MKHAHWPVVKMFQPVDQRTFANLPVQARMASGASPARGSWRVLAALAVLALAMGCRPTTTIGANQAVGESKQAADQTVSSNQLKQKGGICDLNKRVTGPEGPEGVIWRMYQIALEPDSEETFAKFAALFPSTKNVRDIRENYWQRVRNNMRKYQVEPPKPDFVICRKAYRDDGTMFYIITSDPRQSPPPITVGPADGTDKIVFLTPF